MSIGFFVAVSPTELPKDDTHLAFVGHTPWKRDGLEREIDLCGRNWRIVCLRDRESGSSRFWMEDDSSKFQGSFVHILGWCYRISSSRASLDAEDYRRMLSRLREGKHPVDDDIGGAFVLLAYDALSQRLAIQPDRLAIGAVFSSQEDGVFAASNRALRVASYFQRALDGYSVLSQMRGTHLPFGRTLFAGVQRLMGCTCIDFDLARGRAEIKKSSSLFLAPRKISYADSVDLVADTVRTTVGRLLGAGPAQFDLTGGNDTRVIASAVENLTRRNGTQDLGFRVVDPEGTPDVRIAQRVADACGWPLTRMDRYSSARASPAELKCAATASDGNFPAPYVWERVSSERSAQAHWNVHVGAASGELFRGFFYAHEMFTLGRSKVNYGSLLAYRTYASRGVNLQIFGAPAPTFDAHDQILLAPYRAIAEEGGSRPVANKLDVMYLQRHCYRSGNTLSCLFGFTNLRVPFLSWELASLGLSLPWKYRTNRGLVQRMIAKLSPKLADIPNEDGQPMKPLSLGTLVSYLTADIPIALQRAGRIARRLLGRSSNVRTTLLPVPQPAYFELMDNRKCIPAIFEDHVAEQIRSDAESDRRSLDTLLAFYVLVTIELLLLEVPTLERKLVFN